MESHVFNSHLKLFLIHFCYAILIWNYFLVVETFNIKMFSFGNLGVIIAMLVSIVVTLYLCVYLFSYCLWDLIERKFFNNLFKLFLLVNNYQKSGFGVWSMLYFLVFENFSLKFAPRSILDWLPKDERLFSCYRVKGSHDP